MIIALSIITTITLLIFISGIRIVRPTERALIETMGNYSNVARPGFNWIIPLFQSMYQLNVTEQMVEIDSQEMITEDKLNANVDLVIFYKVKTDEQSLKNSVYNVNNFANQITILAQTTGRNVIGGMLFKDVNAERNKLNKQLADIMKIETKNWGVEIVRVELKEIIPPKDVQDTMNKVIKAENEKRAAIDFATAKETEADGIKRAAIKEAEGIAQGRRIVADATAYKTKVENEAAEKYFKGNAKELKQLETIGSSLQNNSKVILGSNAKDVLKLFDLNK